jgi:tetratricopeptide (TPR) repeat protein
VLIVSRGKKWSATTAADGSFFVSSLVAGDYNVQADGDSLPAGYSTDGFGDAQKVTVGATAPGKAAFAARAFRSISGRVLVYDTNLGRYVPVASEQVILQEPGSISITDVLGRYLFRDLAAGAYTLSVQNEGGTPARKVRLGAQPVDLTNVDFEISRPVSSVPAAAVPAEKLPPPAAKTPEAAAPAVLIAKSQQQAVKLQQQAAKPEPLAPQPANAPGPTVLPAKPEPLAATAAGSITAAAEQHNTLGRQLSAAGRYREAIAELTEALRIAPDFAVAFNARGFAWFKLHRLPLALKDLDQAILLNPKYANAYRIRGVVRKSMGNARGAAADLKKSQQLAR